ELVSEHRRDDVRNAGAGCGRGGAGAAVMDDCRDPRKQNVVAHIAYGNAIGRIVNEIEIGPTSRDDDPAAHGTGSADEHPRRIARCWHAAEAGKNGWFSASDECFEIRGKRSAIREHPRAGLKNLSA